jgi:4-hydroxy-tetrahydrodipicolinate synthase
MATRGATEFLVLPPIPTILAAREDPIDRVVEEEDQRRVSRYVLQDCDGFLMGGTTGHGPTLTENQFAALLRISLQIKKAEFPSKRVLVGAIEPSDGRVKEKIYKAVQIEQAVGAQIDGFVVPPQAFFYLKSPREIYAAMKAISEYAERFNRGVYLYNIPRAGATLRAAEVAELKRLDNIRGIKDSSGDEALYGEFLKLQDGGFGVFQGKPQLNLKVLESGGRGIVDANANFAPSLIREMVEAFFAGDRQKAAAIHQRVLNSTDYLNPKDPGFQEIRLACRQAQLYLLGIIETLPRPLTEPELRYVGEGLIKNEIPKVELRGARLTAADPFTARDLESRLAALTDRGYIKNGEGRFELKGYTLD